MKAYSLSLPLLALQLACPGAIIPPPDEPCCYCRVPEDRCLVQNSEDISALAGAECPYGIVVAGSDLTTLDQFLDQAPVLDICFTTIEDNPYLEDISGLQGLRGGLTVANNPSLVSPLVVSGFLGNLLSLSRNAPVTVLSVEVPNIAPPFFFRAFEQSLASIEFSCETEDCSRQYQLTLSSVSSPTPLSIDVQGLSGPDIDLNTIDADIPAGTLEALGLPRRVKIYQPSGLPWSRDAILEYRDNIWADGFAGRWSYGDENGSEICPTGPRSCSTNGDFESQPFGG